MLDDNELLYLASENNEIAIESLYNKYKRFILYKVSQYNHSSFNKQDYLNIANLAFYKAIEIYKDNNKFITILNVCIDRKLQTYKNELGKKKNILLNEAAAFDDNVSVLDNTYNPEDVLLNEENYECLKKTIIKSLNNSEELVFILREQNFTCKEISQILGSSINRIYKIIRKIKQKISKIPLEE